MLHNRKRFIPLLTLLLCSLLTISVPVKVIAASGTVTGFDASSGSGLTQYFSKAEFEYSATGSGSASITTNDVDNDLYTVEVKAKGSGSGGCNDPYVGCTTTVTLTAKKSVSFQFALTGSAQLDSAPEIDYETNTVIVGEEATVTFKVYTDNATEQSGTFTLSNFAEADPKVPNDCAAYSINGKGFSYLDEAITEAESGTDKTIVVTKDGTVYHSDFEDKDSNNGKYTKSFTIPSGVTLLIPFDGGNTLYTTEPGHVLSYTSPTVNRKLTLADGTSIEVDGAISLSAQVSYTTAKNKMGSPTGPVSFIDMKPNSSIVINNGGALYAWGYIMGSGTVTANNGASVYECFQITDYRGGSQSTERGMNNYDIFPMSQYYVQNIEVPLTLHYGAKEYAHAVICAKALLSDYKAYASTVSFVGTSGSMFNLESGTSLVKWYDGSTDRLKVDVNGSMNISPISLQIDVYTKINSAEYDLPITSNMTININSGTTMVNQDIALLPGSMLNIADGATVQMGSGYNLFVYDVDQWEEFVYAEQYSGTSYNQDGAYHNLRMRPLAYAPGRSNGVDRASQAMADATICVNGTLSANTGFLYTTCGPMTYKEGPTVDATYTNHYVTVDPENRGGANIYSKTSTGKVVITSGTTANVYQVIQDAWHNGSDTDDDYYIAIPVSAAKLTNSNGDLIATVAGTYVYDVTAGAWRCEIHTDEDGNHICDVCGYVTECVDEVPADGEFADHICDICGETLSECAETDGDSLCDICGANLCSHDEVTATEAVPATCVSDGTKAYWQCTACGNSYSNEELTTVIEDLEAWKTGEGKLEMLGHTYGETTYNWTPHTACVATRTCTLCHEDADGHSQSANAEITHEVTKAATCKETGERTYTATFDVDWAVTQTATEEIAVDPDAHTWDNACDTECNNCGTTREITHSYESVVTAPTCTDGGFTTHTCTICGDSYTDSETSALGCSFSDEWKTDSDNHWYVCSVCGEETDKAAHADGNNDHKCDTCEYVMSECSFTVKGELKTAGTCMAEAVHKANCSVCGAVSDTVTITGEKDTSNHTGVNHTENAKDATCTEAGYTGDTVCECGATVSTGSEIPALGHKAAAAVNENEKAATCYAEGSYDEVVYCSTCKTHEISRDTKIIEKSAHTHAEAVEENHVESTCTVAGSYESVVYCSVEKCNAEISREKKALPLAAHTEVVDAAVDATCAATGLTEGKHCSVCNAVLVAQTEIVAQGHSSDEPVEENRVEADCTTAGSYDQVLYCSRCGEEISRDTVTVSATGHTYDENHKCAGCGVIGGICGNNVTWEFDENSGILTISGTGNMEDYQSEGLRPWHYYCNQIANVVIAEGVTSIGDHAFWYCKNLTSITIPDGVTSIGDAALTGTGLVDITIPDSVTSIGYSVFADCDELINLTIPNGLTQISDMAFNSCDKLTSVTIPDSINSIGGCAFMDCPNLISMTIPAGVTSIGKSTFNNCASMISVTIPDSVTSIAIYAFAGCNNLTDVYYGGTEEQWTNIVVASDNDDLTGARIHFNDLCASGYTEVADVAVAPTCTAPGLTEGSHCSVCNTVIIAQTEVAALGHTEVVDAAVAPTCTATGLTEGKHCSVCGEVLVKQEVVDTLEHGYTSEVTTQPTCTTAGVKTYTCAGCGNSYTEEIEALDHDMVAVAGKAATCTEDGYTAYTDCSRCDHIEGKEVIPAGHSIAQGEAQTKTCTQDGWEAYEYCTECDYTTKFVIPAGHTLTQVEAKEPTCTEIGWETYESCSECDYTTYKEIPTVDHVFTKYEGNDELKTAFCDYGCGAVDTRIENTDGDAAVDITPDTTDQDKVKAEVDKEQLDKVVEGDLDIQMNSGILELIFESEAVQDIVKDLKAKDKVTINVENATPANAENSVRFDIYLAVNGTKKDRTQFSGEYVTVTIDLQQLKDTLGDPTKDVEIWYVDENGQRIEKMDHEKDGTKVKFKTKHFSYYEVVAVDEATTPTVTVNDPANGTAIAHNIVETEDGWKLTLSAEDDANTYVYLVKYTDANGVVSEKIANADGKYNGESGFAIPADAVAVMVKSAVLGDVTGDGEIKAGDYRKLKDYLMSEMSEADFEKIGELGELAGDVTGDGNIKAGDYKKLKNYLMSEKDRPLSYEWK